MAALLLALWFALTAGVWVYWGALFVAYPAGLVSLWLWNTGRKTDLLAKRYQLVAWILVAGTVWSLSVLCYLLIFD